MTKEEVYNLIRDSLSAFLKECPVCKQKFKDTLDIRIICLNYDREQKINKVLEK